MTTLIATHEVADGEVWAAAWKQKPGSRHEMMAKVGVKARAFRDPQNPNMTGLILEVPDLAKFDAFMQSAEAQQAMKEDGLKPETLRIIHEFTP